MEESMVVEIDCTTGVETIRPMTTEELAMRQQMLDAEIARNEAAAAEAEATATAKASAHDKLSALGLTPEEIAALSK